MTGRGAGDSRKLAELRDTIDTIDAEMHRLLVERGTIIDALIRTKGTEKTGAAFRPGREADMMRRLVARHRGELPITTVEHIWREIITTFTRMQAPFDVATDGSADPDRMRDLARFYFGFSVDLLRFSDAAAVVAHVAAIGDLGIVARDQDPAVGAWWRALGKPSGPQIMAVLPYIEIPGRPADLPAFVISPRLSDQAAPDIRILAVTAKGDFPPPRRCSVLASVGGDGQTELLLAVPEVLDVARFAAETGGRLESVVEVGGIATGIAVDGAASMLYQSSETVGSPA
jgi:chorismate mutase / prephenate dehydratase